MRPLCCLCVCQVAAAVPGNLALAANGMHQANALRCSELYALVHLPCCWFGLGLSGIAPSKFTTY